MGVIIVLMLANVPWRAPLRIIFQAAIFILVVTVSQSIEAQDEPLPAMGLAPDPGFPIWLTPDSENYLPLVTSQTSGLDWIGTETNEDGITYDRLLLADDSDDGGVHIIEVADSADGPSVTFINTNLTPPEPSVVGFNFIEEYDWEAISFHHESESGFIVQEGLGSEVGIYHFRTTGSLLSGIGSGDPILRCGAVESMPVSFFSVTKLDLPDWNTVYISGFPDNLGIEGIACAEDRLFVGLESPYDFTTRLLHRKSTTLAIWSIDPENPGASENCRLLAVHDTAEWEISLGFKIETICGLDALEGNRVIGVDRDNTRLFAVRFSDTGEFLGGRMFYLDVPGPAPLESDGCPELEDLPVLLKPTLESVASVPVYDSIDSTEPSAYRIYLACDPWRPGWALLDTEWDCPAYRDRLNALLPALYRYTVPIEILFPESETDLLLVGD